MQTLGIILHGVTGRMGKNQHLLRSILPIIQQGGVQLKNGEFVQIKPVLAGRNHEKLKALAEETGIQDFSTDLNSLLQDPNYSVFFDAASTQLRAGLVSQALAFNKHVYTEKPLTETWQTAQDLADQAQKLNLKNGVVQDKLFLPGLLKLKKLLDEGFFGTVLTCKIDFGYWVFDGIERTAQRPSWNYRKKDGGGIMLDMLCHWHYILEHLFGSVKSLCCLSVNHIQTRADEQGKPYTADTDDAAYALVEMHNSMIAQINFSWVTRVRREDLVVFQVDGTQGSAFATLTDCYTQSAAETPCPVWNPDQPQTQDFFKSWQKVKTKVHQNGFKTQWELFIRHLYAEVEFPWNFVSAVRGLKMVEAAVQSSQQRAWVDLKGLG